MTLLSNGRIGVRVEEERICWEQLIHFDAEEREALVGELFFHFDALLELKRLFFELEEGFLMVLEQLSEKVRVKLSRCFDGFLVEELCGLHLMDFLDNRPPLLDD